MPNFGLTIKDGVILTDSIRPGIAQLDAAYKDRNISGLVSSGLRTPERQVDVIRGLAKDAGLEFDYLDSMNLNSTTSYSGAVVFQWQIVWSKLMSLMFDVNPPIAATLLMDRFIGGVNKRGKVYPPTEHSFGISFDIEGEYGGQQLLDIYTNAFLDAVKENEVPAIISYTKEVKNNCLHLNCKNVDLATNESSIPSVS
jgi:hypothetical protein